MQRKPIFDAIRRLLGRGLQRREVVEIDSAIATAEQSASFLPQDRVTPGPCLTPSGRKIGPAGIALIKRFEGCARRRSDGLVEAYADPGTGGAPWTIGWGATGPEIGPGTVWSQAQSDGRLEADLARYADEVAAAIGDVPTNQAQFDALVSFHYNTGAIARATLTRKHLAGDYAGAAAEFGRWNRAGGREMRGLTLRRAAEAALYLSAPSAADPGELASAPPVVAPIRRTTMYRLLGMTAALAVAAASPALAQGKGGGHGHGGGGQAAMGHGGGEHRGGKGEDGGKNRGGGEGAAMMRSSQRSATGQRVREAKSDIGREARAEHGRSAHAENVRDNRVDRAEVSGDTRGGHHGNGREIDRNWDRSTQGDRRLVRTSSRDGFGDDYRAQVDRNDSSIPGCPPGLAKKNNGCLPPGLAKQYRNQSLGYDYRPSLFGVPTRTRADYSYYDGYLIPVGGAGSYIPLLGGALAAGQLWPQSYPSLQIADWQQNYYGFEDPRSYRYADDVVYRVDPQTAAIQSVAALLTGSDFTVGQRVPAGYDVYNVPYGYQDRYRDSDQALYRYADGRVYQIDPTTMLIAQAIELIL